MLGTYHSWCAEYRTAKVLWCDSQAGGWALIAWLPGGYRQVVLFKKKKQMAGELGHQIFAGI